MGMRVHNARSGFSVIELAVVVMIAGVMAVMAIRFVIPLYHKAQQVELNEKMRILQDALDAYALRNFRLPCPADPRLVPAGGEPYGAERFSGAAGDAIPPNCGAAAAGWTGVVPFRALGIPENVIRDPWGHYITYAVSPAFALDTRDATIPVHAACRTREWFYLRDGQTLPRAARKARFCCPGISDMAGNHIYAFGDDLVVQARTGAALLNVLADPDPRQATGLGVPDTCTEDPCEAYAPAATIFTATPNVLVPQNDVSTGIAYVLVSHGRNGLGHLQADGTVSDFTAAGADESENADGDRSFVQRLDVDESGANAYDDRLAWKTQDLIFVEQGDSCALP